MRTNEDQLQMRTLFTECDLISAEIQMISGDGQISLHTRTLKYGKLENGQLIIVPPSLVKRLPQHYVTFPWGVDVILGRNGYIWITRTLLLTFFLFFCFFLFLDFFCSFENKFSAYYNFSIVIFFFTFYYYFLSNVLHCWYARI